MLVVAVPTCGEGGTSPLVMVAHFHLLKRLLVPLVRLVVQFRTGRQLTAGRQTPCIVRVAVDVSARHAGYRCCSRGSGV